MENFRYIVDNCVLIQHVWEEDPSRIIKIVDKTLNNKINYITKAIKVNIEEDKFGDTVKEGDILFLSRYISTCKKFKISESFINNYDYSNIPVKLLIGRFKDNIISINNLELFYDKVLIEPLKDFKQGDILIPNNTTCNVGRVVKHGKGGLFRDYTRRKPIVSINDIILFWDNITTEITLNDKKYLALDDCKVIGKFKDDVINIDNLELLSGRILLKDMEVEKLNISSNIILPSKNNSFDYEFTSNYENKYEILKVSERGREVKENIFVKCEEAKVGDIIIVQKDYVQYVYFKGNLYYTLNDIEDAEAIVVKD